MRNMIAQPDNLSGTPDLKTCTMVLLCGGEDTPAESCR